jgi:hypothetical protein
MISFDLRTHIVRPLRQVFQFVTTPENDFQWQYGTLASARLSQGAIGIGSIFRVLGHFLGERMESIFEVTGFEPYRTYGFRSQSSPIFSSTLYSLDMKGGMTELSLSVQMDPGESFKPGIAVTEKRLKKQYRENLSLLKDLLEATPVERPQQPPARAGQPQERR